MGDYFDLKLDLAKMATRMSAQMLRLVPETEVLAWLRENGFEKKDDHWVAENADIAQLQTDEILSIWIPWKTKPRRQWKKPVKCGLR